MTDLNTLAREHLWATHQRDAERRRAIAEEDRHGDLKAALCELMIVSLAGKEMHSVGAMRWRILVLEEGLDLQVEVHVETYQDSRPDRLIPHVRLEDTGSNRVAFLRGAPGGVAFGPSPASRGQLCRQGQLWPTLLSWLADARGLTPLAPTLVPVEPDTKGAADRTVRRMRERFDVGVDLAEPGGGRTVSPGSPDSPFVVRSILPLAPEAGAMEAETPGAAAGERPC
ncbi:MAG: hypothetical protein AAFQ43_00470 [Bacteroidota bacterium]